METMIREKSKKPTPSPPSTADSPADSTAVAFLERKDPMTGIQEEAASTIAEVDNANNDNNDAGDDEEIDELALLLVGLKEKVKSAVLPPPRKKRKYKKRASKQTTTAAAAQATQPQPQFYHPPQSKEETRRQIRRAAALVSKSLLLGAWPSPYRSLVPPSASSPSANIGGDYPHRPGNQNSHANNNYQAHRAHVSMVGASLQKFAIDVITPAMLTANESGSNNSPTSLTQNNNNRNNKKDIVLRTGQNQRVFLGALLLYRELLCQNAVAIFGPSAMLTGREDDFGASLAEVITDDDKEDDEDDDSEADDTVLFSVQVLATAVILTGLADLGEQTELLKDDFLDMAEAYE